MYLWTLTGSKATWQSCYALRRSDSMGNVLDRAEKDKKSGLTLCEYPEGFLDEFEEMLDSYVYEIEETSSYDNDDYPEYSYTDRKSQYTEGLSRYDVVVAGGRPVGHIKEFTSYGGGMSNRTSTEGYIAYFAEAFPGEKCPNSYRASGGDRRTTWCRTYTLKKRK